MSKSWLAATMRLRDHGFCNVDSHWQDAYFPSYDGAGKDLHSIRAAVELPRCAGAGFFWR
jgi:hypothetical protein